MPQPPYPLHPSIKDKIHPDYVAFYKKHLIDKQQVHYQPVAASRVGGDIIPGRGPYLPVASTKDYTIQRLESDGPEVPVRVFTPEGDKPQDGWPVFIYYHGGGWVLGNIDTENTVCTNICNRVGCVVISVDYRLAPENPFPAAVHDSWEAVLWTIGKGSQLLSLDTDKIAVGGSSAGGNLAAVMCQRAAVRGNVKFLLQVLMVPVMDNTADVDNNAAWKECEHCPALPAAKMLWYRSHYLPDPSTYSHPEASPLLWTGNWSLLPPAVIVAGGMDVLREEGMKFGEKLSKAKKEGQIANGVNGTNGVNGVGKKVETKVKVMEGMPHPFLAMDGVLDAGKEAITAMVEGLKGVF